MDVQTKKLHLIEKLLQVEDSDVLERVKALLESEESGQPAFHINGRSISNNALLSRANQANDAIEIGNYKTLSQLKHKAKSWK